jgi:hypothetical protein
MAGYMGKDSMRDHAERMFRDEDSSPRESNFTKVSRSAMGVGEQRPYARGGKVAHKEIDHHERRVVHTDHHHGKKVHPLTKTQTDLHLPKHLSYAGGKLKSGGGRKCLNVETMKEMKGMSHGGSERAPIRKASGGTIYEHDMMGMHPSHTPRHINYVAQERGNTPIRKAYKKGGHCYDDGGMVQQGQPAQLQTQQQPQQQGQQMKPYSYGFNGTQTSMPGTALKKGGRTKRAEGGEMKEKEKEMRPMMRKEGGTNKYACGGVAKLRLGEMSMKGMPLHKSHNPGKSTNHLPHLHNKQMSRRAILKTQ